MASLRQLTLSLYACVCCACGGADARSELPTRVPQQGTAGTSVFAAGTSAQGSGGGAAAGALAQAGAQTGLPAGVGTAGTAGRNGGAGASPGAGPTSAGTGATPPAASGGAATAAAGASTPTLPMMSMMSSGCGKTGSMTGAFQGTIKVADLDRGYYLSVPTPYDANEPHRLVFGYHGSNYTGKMMRQYLDNEKPPLLDNSIFVYPDGLPLPNEPDNVAWVLDPNGRDLAFHDALYTYLTTNYCVDTTRVFVNGQSFGGLMTNFVGCQRGDTIRAIAVVAGSGPYGSQCQGKVAVWLTHGMDDMNVPFSSGEASRNFWVKANGCSDMTVPGMPAQCQVYQGCDPENPVIWCPHVNDGGHQTPSFGRKAYRDFLGSF